MREIRQVGGAVARIIASQAARWRCGPPGRVGALQGIEDGGGDVVFWSWSLIFPRSSKLPIVAESGVRTRPLCTGCSGTLNVASDILRKRASCHPRFNAV